MAALSHLASYGRPRLSAGFAGAGLVALLALAAASLDGVVLFAVGGLIETLAGLR